jgi:opacity protein-like surface antigen
MFKRSFLTLAAAIALFSPASAADLPPFPAKAPAAAFACAAGSCSGWYGGFGVLGEGSNVDIVGNGINGSVFSTGGVIKVQGGYQLWNGAFFAALDLSAGYEFTKNNSTGAPVANAIGRGFVGLETVKLGYNFFPSTATAVVAPSQSSVPLIVPANLLASTTPYFRFGGMQRHGQTMWVNGAGLQTVISAGWTSDVSYLYAPAQGSLPATNVVMFELNKHF